MSRPYEAPERRLNTSETLAGKSTTWPCDVCNKRVHILYYRSDTRWTCPDCTPERDQWVTEVKE